MRAVGQMSPNDWRDFQLLGQDLEQLDQLLYEHTSNFSDSFTDFIHSARGETVKP